MLLVKELEKLRIEVKFLVVEGKPWRQKGTGRARQGSTRATQWVGGGIPFGVRPRDYTFKINKKERVIALKSALSSKVQEKALVVVDISIWNLLKLKML